MKMTASKETKAAPLKTMHFRCLLVFYQRAQAATHAGTL